MLALGVDIGGTNARAAVVDCATARLVASAKVEVTQRSPDAVAELVSSLVGRVAHGHPVEGAPVGVGLAAMLSGDRVVNAPNLGWRDVEFGALLERRLGRRVCVVNDLAAAAWGELEAGAARGARDTFTVFVGTGVGAAIISGRQLVHGATGVAGEFGHVKVFAEGGRPCGCGELGCLEAYAGGANLAAWMREAGLEGNAAELEALARAGDSVARGMYDTAAGALALAIANQVTVLNPAVLVLGGGVLRRCPGLVQRVKDTVRRRSTEAARAGLRIELAQLGDDSGLFGAALLGASG